MKGGVDELVLGPFILSSFTKHRRAGVDTMP